MFKKLLPLAAGALLWLAGSPALAQFTPVNAGTLTGDVTKATGQTATTVVKILGQTPANIATSGSASDLVAGTMPCPRHPALTGDITMSQGSCVTVLAHIPALDGSALTNLNASALGSGTVPPARMPNPAATTLGGVQSIAPVSHQFLTGISTAGVPSQVQPAAADISGLAPIATSGSGADISSGVVGSTHGGAGAVNGLLKANGSGTVTAAASGTDYAPATSGSAILKGNGAGAFANAASGTDYAPATSGAAILKGNSAGGFASAASGTDYAPATSGAAILKGNGAGGFSSAASGTDYAPATSGSAILKGNGTGGFSNAASGTDYAPATSGAALLKGNGAGAFANAASGTDYAPATSGSAILKGNGAGGFTSAASGTDYAPATAGSALLKGNGSGGFSSAASGTDYAPATSGSAALKGNGSGGFSTAACADLSNASPSCSIDATKFYNISAGSGVSTTLTNPLGSSTTGNVTVGSTANWPTNATLLLFNELVTATVVDATTVNIIARGQYGTTGATHSGGSAVDLVVLKSSSASSSGIFFTTAGQLFVSGPVTVTGTTTQAVISGLIKADSAGITSKATSGTDYAPATSGAAILKGNSAGGFANAVAGTDYLNANQTITASGDCTGSGATALALTCPTAGGFPVMTTPGLVSLQYGLTIFGASNACAAGASNQTTTGTSWAARLNVEILAGQGPYNNYCLAGAYAADTTTVVFNHLNPAETGNPVVIINNGTNDSTSAIGDSVYTRIYEAELLRAAVSSINVVQGSACTTTGTVSSDTTYSGITGQQSTTNGSTFTCTINAAAALYGTRGSNAIVYLWYGFWPNSSTAGSFTVTIDGVSATDTISGNSTITSQVTSGGWSSQGASGANGRTIALARFLTTAGSHTVVITVASATSASNPVSVLGLAATRAGRVGGMTSPRVFALGTPVQENDASSAATALKNSLNLAAVGALAADGWAVNFVNVRGFMNTTMDFSSSNPGGGCPNSGSGGLHFNDCGHRDAFNAIVDAFGPGWAGSIPTYGATGTLTTAYHFVTASVTLSGGTGTLTFSNKAVFSSSSSYTCWGNDTTAAGTALGFANGSGTSTTLTGTGSHVIAAVCGGN